ncbi:MAG: penicillin-binding protein 2, partial [Alphaproteobacteria bacterium]
MNTRAFGATRATYMPPRLDGQVRQALEVGRIRMIVAAAAMVLAFTIVGLRLTELALFREAPPSRAIAHATTDTGPRPRGDIVDRNGEILATDLATASLYANPRRLLDPEEAARGLVTVLPDLDYRITLAKLRTDRTFVWLRRNLTPREQWEVNRLGLPGLDFIAEYDRVYPHGPLLAHVLGYVDSDNKGIAGVEARFDESLATDDEALKLTIDLRVQYILREELRAAMLEFRAKGAAGVVMDVTTGEVIALTSLPDFDPNHAGKARDSARFNRATLGVYELGSTFKVFTVAIALDSGTASFGARYDATRPLRVSRFTIRDYHAKNRWLTLPEVFMYSSNIGAARMAGDIGGKTQRDYLSRLGLLDPSAIELPEVGRPIVPSPWRPVNTMTIGFGHGLAVSPLQLAAGVAAIVNGGTMNDTTIVLRDNVAREGRQVISSETSRRLRQLMRLTVKQGTGRKAEAARYPVGGKTGTAEKPGAKGYAKRSLISSFVGVFPITQPRYVVLAVLDEPKGTKKTYGFATGGWVAAPVIRRVVER